ncbi:galactosamine-6-phosphate isomerase [Algoriphagus boseongensis]|uniref:Galactosamine-6-phosphate isomerase n=1 Tax=Algoriphagus boseongensis TaxID=1442587 RepID=A0A4V3D2F0_9BACT|nr:6-phosphogluconolactonase [Algoriphagus boseongensis]TDQ18747.1 galactosamine-6-phosphate isomerase [Algoriphagus boseongensis]
MNFHYLSNFEEMSLKGFEFVKHDLSKKPDLLFCVASGGSPSGLYKLMAQEKNKQPDFCSHLRVIKLDEWGGLDRGSPFTSEEDVQNKFIQPLGISSDRYWTIDPFTQNPEKDCEKMEAQIQKEGPIDICILGIGVNGHIALNEPADKLAPDFHINELAQTSLSHGMLKGSGNPPSFGMTMGMRNILQSKRILLFIAGSGKKQAFEKLLSPEISTWFPASFLWLHPNVEVLVDQTAIA